MRTDSQLQEGVLKAIALEPSVNASQIGITVQQGVGDADRPRRRAAREVHR